MKKKSLTRLILILPFLISSQLKSQNINFKNFQALNEDFFFLEQESKTVLGSYYHLGRDSVIKDILKAGRGPFEIENIGAFSYDNTSERLFVGDISNGKIISYNLSGVPILENTLKIPYLINLDAYDGKLVASQGILLRDSKNLANYPLAFILDQNSIEITDTLFFDLRKLQLDTIENSPKVKIFEIRPQVIALENDLFLATFQSVSTIFLIDSESDVLASATLKIPGFQGMKIIEHPRYGYGQIMYSVLNDFVRIKDSIYLSFGHKSKGIPPGVVSVEVINGNALKTNTFLVDETDILTNQFIITTDGIKIYGTNGTKIFPLTFK